MPTLVRPIRDDELTAYVDAVSTGFLDRPDVAAARRRGPPALGPVAGRCAAFEDGRIVGTFRSWAGRLTVPGCREVQASSVTAVTVSPTERRRGILGRMAAAEHAAARERGDIVAILFASEYPIYGRFGYGPATTTATWTVRTHQTRLVPRPDDDGRIEIAPTDEATRDPAAPSTTTWRVRQPGEVWRRPITWDDDFGLSAGRLEQHAGRGSWRSIATPPATSTATSATTPRTSGRTASRPTRWSSTTSTACPRRSRRRSGGSSSASTGSRPFAPSAGRPTTGCRGS